VAARTRRPVRLLRRRRGRLPPARPPRAVWPAVRSACRNALRAFRRANAPPKAPTPDPPLPPPVAARLVRLLTPREARILALTYGRRLDPDATARELNLSPATVAWHLAKALAKLRRLARKEPPPCSPPTPPPPTPPDLS
jgi:DNA-binding CsgD family transcriptional regulator